MVHAGVEGHPDIVVAADMHVPDDKLNRRKIVKRHPPKCALIGPDESKLRRKGPNSTNLFAAIEICATHIAAFNVGSANL